MTGGWDPVTGGQAPGHHRLPQGQVDPHGAVAGAVERDVELHAAQPGSVRQDRLPGAGGDGDRVPGVDRDDQREQRADFVGRPCAATASYSSAGTAGWSDR